MSNIVLHFNSRRKASGFNTLCSFTLQQQISNFKSFEILGVEIPYSFYNCPTGSNYICDIYNINTSATIAPVRTYGAIYYTAEAPGTLLISIELDGFIYTVDVTWYTGDGMNPHTYPEIGNLIVGDGSVISSCVVSLSGYRMNFAITTVASYRSVAIRLTGTSSALATYIGLSNDVVDLRPTPSTSFNLLMPGLYYRFNRTNLGLYLRYASYRGYVTTVSYYTCTITSFTYDYYVDPPVTQMPLDIWFRNSGGQLSQVSNTAYIRIDTSKHVLAHKLGIQDGIYLGNTVFTAPPYFIPPRQYDYSAVTVIGTSTTRIDLNFTAGNYTASELATILQTRIRTNARYTASTVVVNSLGLIVITLICDTPVNMLGFSQIFHYGTTSFLDMLGFGDQWVGEYSTSDFMEGDGLALVKTGINITTAIFTASKPFKNKPTLLRVGSNTLGILVNSLYNYDDEPDFAIPNIIHKIQVNASPTGTITDNQKYTTKKIVNKFRTPITSIDFGLYDEDGQVVELNGLDWSITVKFNL